MIARMNILKPHSCDHTKYDHNPAAISTEGVQHRLPMTGCLSGIPQWGHHKSLHWSDEQLLVKLASV